MQESWTTFIFSAQVLKGDFQVSLLLGFQIIMSVERLEDLRWHAAHQVPAPLQFSLLQPLQLAQQPCIVLPNTHILIRITLLSIRNLICVCLKRDTPLLDHLYALFLTKRMVSSKPRPLKLLLPITGFFFLQLLQPPSLQRCCLLSIRLQEYDPSIMWE